MATGGRVHDGIGSVFVCSGVGRESRHSFGGSTRRFSGKWQFFSAREWQRCAGRGERFG